MQRLHVRTSHSHEEKKSVSTSDVSVAATALVAAFGTHNRAEYFDAFAPSASFIFHNYEKVLESRSAYEKLWDEWVADGFKVLGCRSSNQQITMLGADVAVFTHTVRTDLADGDGSITTGERETIIFQKIDGRWLGVHEHLSIDPTFLV